MKVWVLTLLGLLFISCTNSKPYFLEHYICMGTVDTIESTKLPDSSLTILKVSFVLPYRKYAISNCMVNNIKYTPIRYFSNYVDQTFQQFQDECSSLITGDFFEILTITNTYIKPNRWVGRRIIYCKYVMLDDKNNELFIKEYARIIGGPLLLGSTNIQCAH